MLVRPFFSVAFLCLALLGSFELQARDLPEFSEIVKRTSPAVVKINSVRKPAKRSRQRQFEGREDEIPEMFRRFFEQRGMPQQRQQQSLGSGFIISADGYILTNNHVIDGADEVTILLQDRREFNAEIIGTDERSDLALLKIGGKNLPTLKINRNDNLEVGDWVLAIGSPFGLDYSVAAGIVSAQGRSLPTEKGENYVPFIQTDVAINPGNSGGPLLNLDGEVVGINSQIFTRSGGSIGLSFAIPSGVAMDVVAQLKDSGQVVRGWLGVGIQDVNKNLADSFGLAKPVGALVSQLVEDGPAQKAGIQEGDVILTFNGKKVGESADLPHIVGRTAPDRSVPVVVFRDGREKTVKVKVGSLDSGSTRQASSKTSQNETKGGKLGLAVAELDDALRAQLKVNKGVVVRDIAPEKPGFDAGIRRGDVITSIDNKTVDSVQSFKEIVKKLPPQKHVAVRMIRNGQPIFLAIKTPK
ncbi:MAG: DegQ family serine endoprotease [Pseudomonadales bacterium]